MAKVAYSWSKPDGMPGLIGRKQVDWSLFLDGTQVPHQFHEDFAEANGGTLPPVGARQIITLVIDGQEHRATLYMTPRPDAQAELQLGYGNLSSQAQLFRQVFSRSYQILAAKRDAEKAAGKKKVYATVDQSEAEYVEFYGTGVPYRYEVRLVPFAANWTPPSFEQIWVELQRIIGDGRAVLTLGDGMANHLTWRGNNGIEVVTERSKDPQVVPPAAFRAAWTTLAEEKVLNGKNLPRESRFRSAAVLAVLALLPHVEYSTEPRITLFLRQNQYSEKHLAEIFELGGSGSVRWPRRPVDSPRLGVVFAHAASRWSGDTLSLHVDTEDAERARTLLHKSKTGHSTLYVFRPVDSGKYTYIRRMKLESELDTATSEVILGPAMDLSREQRSWIFQANPEVYDLEGASAQLKELTWSVNRYASEIKAGDEVFLWLSGPTPGVRAYAIVVTDPAKMEANESEAPYWLKADKFGDGQLRVCLRIEKALSSWIAKEQLLKHPVLSSVTFLRMPTGTIFPLTPAQAAELRRMVLETEDAPERDLSRVVAEFSAALHHCHIHFGARHDEFVRAFVASLATKPFVILTGLSGSGKTQIALRFGQWLGEGRYLIVPVRPDWTGSEHLFGYEDALQKGSDGRPTWFIPEPLAFMLKATRDPSHPYLLVLDEMNLAHVERYFADVLSGMESGQGCLPNVQRNAGGTWQAVSDGQPRLPFPQNLFIIGTVNVDETTYMFSPKVLDRANTFEFRVSTDDLSLEARKPEDCQPGKTALVRGFLEIARDTSWQLDHPAGQVKTFTEHVRNIHRLLSEAGFEFGHRVFYEAIRFAALLEAAGVSDPYRALDLQIYQKVLPRLHGNRKQLEALLSALGQYCVTLSYTPDSVSDGSAAHFNPSGSGEAAKLPLSFDKLSRMMRTLKVNQFTSFTE